MTMRDVYDLFRPYGRIRAMDPVLSRSASFCGKVLISYTTTQEATRALESLNNSTIAEGSWPIFIQYSEKVATTDPPVRSEIRIERRAGTNARQEDVHSESKTFDCGSNWYEQIFGDDE
jgi:hypothetical protein